MTWVPSILKAMPEGSSWRLYSHEINTDLGQFDVLAHRRSGIEVYIHRIQQKATLPYPADNQWRLERDHIRMGGPDGKLKATYAPA